MTATRTWDEARRLLDPYVAGEVERESGDVDAYCPVHEDNRRSATFNFQKGVWFCHAEDIGGGLDELVAQKDSWKPPPRGASTGRKLRKARGAPSGEAALPTEADISRWHKSLLHDAVALEDLQLTRYIWTSTVATHEIGWDRAADGYTIPVRDFGGELLNVRRYQMRPRNGRRKIWGITGHNAPTLYPVAALEANPAAIIVCEGEWDALVTNQFGFPAVTRTGAAKVAWRPEWSPHFKDKVVYVCHDCDHPGQDANRKVARALLDVAAEVRVVRLPYAITEKAGKDLTDWWIEHDYERDAFQRLLDEALPFDEAMGEDPEDVDPSPAAVVDAFDSRRAGKPLAITVTVKGKREPGYSVPRVVQFRCTRDAGKKCELCPMKVADDGMDRVIAGADPLILDMMDANKVQVADVLRKSAGIAKCVRLNVTITEHQAVEVLYARPSVDHSNGSDNGDYKNIKLTSVGRHDTSPNQTVRVVGALHPDPRRQLNEFLTWDLAKMETSLDRFDMSPAAYKQLQRFQPKPGVKPLAMLRSISNDVATHVTRIYGRPEMHAAMDLTFHSAVSFDFDGVRIARGWLELLVVGDTRTGKSEAASRLVKFYGAGEVVSCESASFAGILGGLQQFGANKEWAITWGAIPLNDRRLVVLDEISGLTPDEIGAMSSVRSSGIAELTKIQQERTYARTRMIWLGNPRNGRMSDYTYGVQAIRPLIGNPEDIARFDLAISIASSDVDSADINRAYAATKQRFPEDACRMLLRWAWSRTPENVVWRSTATAAVYREAEKIGRRYTEDPPLIQAANVREKIARLAVAIAARLFSTDERGEDVIVRKEHVVAAVAFIDHLYNMQGFGYAERSREVIADAAAAESEANVIKARIILHQNVGLAKFMRSQGKFRRQDLEEILDIDREEANAIISELYDLRMIYKDRGDVRLTPSLHRLLRDVK